LSAFFILVFLFPGTAGAAQPTIVSLLFDDGTADQYVARSMLAPYSLHASFYVNSSHVGSDASDMTWTQLTNLATDGHEIGGHGLDHVDLTSVSSAEATRQVCDDRQALISRGFTVTDFAYPFGAYNASVESIVRGCGYTSATRSWGLCGIGQSPPNCDVWYPDVAETIPPQDILATRTIPSIRTWHTLADLESVVTRAENNGGGWVPIVLHHICDGCDPGNYSTSPAVLADFIAWLAGRGSSGTYVRSVREVVSDTTPPVSSIACNGSACSGWYKDSVSVSLSATDAGTAVAAIRYTTDGSTPTASSSLYTAPFSVSTTSTVKFRAWDVAGNVEATKSQPVQIDSAAPVSSISCNGSGCAASAYAAPVSVTLSATDSGGSDVAAIRYTTDGSTPTVASTLYSGAFTVSATATVKYRAWDVAGNVEQTNSQLIQVQTSPTDTTAPVSSIACNGSACSAWYKASVTVTLSATDGGGSGVAAIRYTTDGSTPTASSALYTAPFSVSATSTVKFRAWDNAGNVEATNSQLVQIDSTAPVSSISCNGSGCAASAYAAPVSVTLSATDSGGSDVAAIRYTTDGSDPTASSTLYSGAFTVSATATVKYRAWDVAGNVEQTNSQLIQVQTSPTDTTAPVSSIACNGSACSAWYKASLTVTLSATDGGGSGVAAIRYTTDGSTPTASSALYTAPFSVSATSTVKFRAWDNAGNVEATNSQLIQIDTTAPTVALTSPVSGATVTGSNVKVVASAADAESGVVSVTFYLDGSVLGTATNSPYQSPWNTKKSAKGQHVLWAVALNRAGNRTTSASVTVTVN
jgi:hypothetical protein